MQIIRMQIKTPYFLNLLSRLRVPFHFNYKLSVLALTIIFIYFLETFVVTPAKVLTCYCGGRALNSRFILEFFLVLKDFCLFCCAFCPVINCSNMNCALYGINKNQSKITLGYSTEEKIWF